MLRLKEKYIKEVAPSLQKKYNFKSIMQVPKLEKIVVNIGVGDATTDTKRLEDAVEEITLITGQRPVVTKSKVSISSFKLRENQGIGAKVTLRGKNM
jgi:large subunit ribosomal protein L5